MGQGGGEKPYGSREMDEKDGRERRTRKMGIKMKDER
jgi:hypothetical protein